MSATVRQPDVRTTFQDMLRSSTGPIFVVLLITLVISWTLILLDNGNLNIRNTLVRSVALGIVAVGQTFVILGKSLDLSVAYQISIAAVLASFFMDGETINIWWAIPAVAAVGAVIGLVNGIIITQFRINAFIATLGMSLVLRGILNAAVNNYTGAVPESFQKLGYDTLLGIPWSVLLLAAVVVAGWWTLRATRFGHHLFAVGESPESARLSGVNADRVVIVAHIICSLTAVMTGLFLASRLGSGAPWVGPDGAYDLESIAAVVLGGTALSGGRGGVPGTFAGVLILAILDNTFNQLVNNAYAKDVVRGAIVILAVAVYAWRQRGSGR